jgi:hypothetical protein
MNSKLSDWIQGSVSPTTLNLTRGRTQRSVLLRVMSRRSRDPSLLLRDPTFVTSPSNAWCGTMRGEGRPSEGRWDEARHEENIAHYFSAIVFWGFCISTAPAWGEYAKICSFKTSVDFNPTIWCCIQKTEFFILSHEHETLCMKLGIREMRYTGIPRFNGPWF